MGGGGGEESLLEGGHGDSPGSAGELQSQVCTLALSLDHKNMETVEMMVITSD